LLTGTAAWVSKYEHMCTQVRTCVCVCECACCFIRLRCLFSKSLEHAGGMWTRRGDWRPRKRASISDKAKRLLSSPQFSRQIWVSPSFLPN